MRSIGVLLRRLGTAWKEAHLVDKCLLIFMAALLIQSACNLFFPAVVGAAADDIDIIVRTSSAAIFGYFLSANFARGRSDAGQAPADASVHTMELADDVPPDSPQARRAIGFVTTDGTSLEGGGA